METEQSTSNTIRADEPNTIETVLTETTSIHSGGNILAVFVVQFDVHKGNVVEWQYPADFDLEGIEYQAICSGLHRIESDVIYFSRQNAYGISVFQNMPTDIERGAHMKAIGIIVQPTTSTGICGQVWTHEEFLKKELSNHMVISENIESSRYEALLKYYTLHQYREDQDETTNDFTPIFNIPELNHHSVNYNLKHNVATGLYKQEEFAADTFLDFVNKLGPDVFILWKAALLRKRIMLVNMPPMEIACKYVYNIHLLGKVPSQYQHGKTELIPKFTVGVNDIPELEKKNLSYVACTPDSIFQIKSDLYDLLITLPTPSFHHPIKGLGTNKSAPRLAQQSIALSDLNSNQPHFKSSVLSTKHNPADFTRFRIMWKQMLSNSSSSWAEFVASEPNDIFGTTAALVTGIYYWLYEEAPEISSATSRFFSSWQNMFAGGPNTRRTSTSSQIPIYLNQTSADESQNLLFDEEEEDAMEINNNEVFDVVAARASSELNAIEQGNVMIKEDNENLLGFFHTLTYYLLSTLESILSMNEEEGCHIINLYPKDLVQLGLDPQTDVDFVTELAQLYFRKRVVINGIYSHQGCMSICCCQRKRRRGNGAIRI